MNHVKSSLLLACLLIVVLGCRQPWKDRFQRNVLEPPFVMDKNDQPSTPLVLATADFNSAGSVLIKIQVGDLQSIDGKQATITVWSGNGEEPSSTSIPPDGGTEVYATNGDVVLQHWTTHLDRNYDPAEDEYWLFVYVNHRLEDETRDPRYLVWSWTPSSSPSPDLPHEFNEL